jgi:hypothetical protein
VPAEALGFTNVDYTAKNIAIKIINQLENDKLIKNILPKKEQNSQK